MKRETLVAIALAGGLLLAAFLWSRSASASEEAPTPPSGEDMPDIEDFIPARYFRKGRTSPIRRIVLHIADGAGSARGTAEYFRDAPDNRPASAHYVVGRDGEIFQCVRDEDTAYHAHAANADSIGIENEARTPGEKEFGADDPGLPFTAANYRSLAQLVRALAAKYGIPLDREHIVGHSEVDADTTHSDCPQGQLDWPTFWAYLTNEV
jgi:N-acetyl-anhydromuramyl-L-alanine amidase AmpD